MQSTQGQGSRHLRQRDVVAVALGVVVDAVAEFVWRLHALRQELQNPNSDNTDSRKNGQGRNF